MKISQKRIISAGTVILIMFLMMPLSGTIGDTLPDLTITDLELSLPDNENTTAVSWNATIENIGLGDATDFSVSFYYMETDSEAILIDSPEVDGLLSTSTIEVGVIWPLSSLSGNISIIVEVNEAQLLQESDYSNNIEIREGLVDLDSENGPAELGAMWNVARAPVINEFRHFIIAPKGLGEDDGVESMCVCIEKSEDHCAYDVYYWLKAVTAAKISLGPHHVDEDERHPPGAGRMPEYLGPIWVRSQYRQVREIQMQVEIILEGPPYYLMAEHFITVSFV